jgi:hypothetical protein
VPKPSTTRLSDVRRLHATAITIAWRSTTTPLNAASVDSHSKGALSLHGADAGGERAAAIYTPAQTAKLNGLDPQKHLHDVLTRIVDPRQPYRRAVALQLPRQRRSIAQPDVDIRVHDRTGYDVA